MTATLKSLLERCLKLNRMKKQSDSMESLATKQSRMRKCFSRSETKWGELFPLAGFSQGARRGLSSIFTVFSSERCDRL